jgi:hypothetical protein
MCFVLYLPALVSLLIAWGWSSSIVVFQMQQFPKLAHLSRLSPFLPSFSNLASGHVIVSFVTAYERKNGNAKKK